VNFEAKNNANMDKNKFMQDYHANMWRFNGIGFISLINQFIGFKERISIKWLLEDISKNFNTKIDKMPSEKIEFVHLFKYAILNAIIKENDIENLFSNLFAIIREFFEQNYGLEDYDENFDEKFTEFLESF